MIDTLFLANKLQEVLCQNSYGMDFLIFGDVGDLKKSKRVGTKIEKYTQGVLEQVSSEIVPIQNIELKVINTELCLFVDINDMAFFESAGKEQSKNLQVIKEILQETLYSINGTTIEMTDGGKTYNVTIAMSEATNGSKTSLGEIGELLPLYINVSFTIFENGINNNDFKLVLNNEEVYTTRLVITKAKTPDQSTFAKDKQSKVYMLMGGKSIDVTMPVLNTEFSRFVYQDIIGHSNNRPVAVVIKSPLGDTAFVGILGNSTITGDIGKNMGYNFAIVQGAERALTFDTNWEKRTPSQQTYTYVKYDNKKETIIWGDGQYTIAEEMGNYVHEYTDTPKCDIYIYKG